jgi:hypothetical protein
MATVTRQGQHTKCLQQSNIFSNPTPPLPSHFISHYRTFVIKPHQVSAPVPTVLSRQSRVSQLPFSHRNITHLHCTHERPRNFNSMEFPPNDFGYRVHTKCQQTSHGTISLTIRPNSQFTTCLLIMPDPTLVN